MNRAIKASKENINNVGAYVDHKKIHYNMMKRSVSSMQMLTSYQCRICSKEVQASADLWAHMRSAHGMDFPNYFHHSNGSFSFDNNSTWKDKRPSYYYISSSSSPPPPHHHQTSNSYHQADLDHDHETRTGANNNRLVLLSNGTLKPLTNLMNMVMFNSNSNMEKIIRSSEDKNIIIDQYRTPSVHHDIRPQPRGTFECKACNKVFNSHQALGGHRASHKKVKGCFAAANFSAIDQSNMINIDDDHDATDQDPAAITATTKSAKKSYNSDHDPEDHRIIQLEEANQSPPLPPSPSSNETYSDPSIPADHRHGQHHHRTNPNGHSAPSNNHHHSSASRSDIHHHIPAMAINDNTKKKNIKKVHECSICHKVFPSGQALGGHKRCHWLPYTTLSAPAPLSTQNYFNSHMITTCTTTTTPTPLTFSTSSIRLHNFFDDTSSSTKLLQEHPSHDEQPSPNKKPKYDDLMSNEISKQLRQIKPHGEEGDDDLNLTITSPSTTIKNLGLHNNVIGSTPVTLLKLGHAHGDQYHYCTRQYQANKYHKKDDERLARGLIKEIMITTTTTTTDANKPITSSWLNLGIAS